MNRIGVSAKQNSRQTAGRKTVAPTQSNFFQANSLQRVLGNRQSAALLQTKLKVGAVYDSLEKQADRVAEQVVRGAAPTETIATTATGVHRKCSKCEDENLLQRKTGHAVANQAGVNTVGANMPKLDGGRTMSKASRAYFEPRFGGADLKAFAQWAKDMSGTANPLSAEF